MDDFTLLCEDCGYELGGLRSGANCPECGRAIEHSRPENRPGTPWQRRPGVFSWASTVFETLRTPRKAFGRVRINAGWHPFGLIVVNLLLAAMIVVAPWTGVFAADPAREARRAEGIGGLASYAGWAALQVLGAAALLFVLTWIECRGIRFFARRRGWRLTKAGAWQICAHASIGWLFCGVFAGLSLALPFSAQRFLGIAPNGTIDLSPVFRTRFDWVQVFGIGAPVIGYLGGLLCFEMLIYHGVRACRYAATLPQTTPPVPESTPARPTPAAPIGASTTSGR